MDINSEPGLRRRFMGVLGCAFVVEAGLYSAITPIVPQLRDRFGLSEAAAGLLMSSYSVGIVIGSLVCMGIVARVDARTTAVAALVALAATTLAFAWTADSHVLIGARLLQGIAGGITWTACVTWVLRVWPANRRGEALSAAVAPAVVGTVLGPAIGTLAIKIGVGVSYTVVAAVCVGAAIAMLQLPRPRERQAPELASTRSIGAIDRLGVSGAVAVVVAGIVVGVVNLAGPQILAKMQSPAWTAGLAFTAAAVVTVAVARPVGRLVDIYGAQRATVVAFVAIAIFLPVLAITGLSWLAVVLIAASVVGVNSCYLAASAMLTTGIERVGGSLYFATALVGTLWGVGESVGAILAGVGLGAGGAAWTLAGTLAMVAVGCASAMLLPRRGLRQGDAQAVGEAEI